LLIHSDRVNYQYLKKESLNDDLRILNLKKKKMIAIMSYMKNVKKYQDTFMTEEVSDYL